MASRRNARRLPTVSAQPPVLAQQSRFLAPYPPMPTTTAHVTPAAQSQPELGAVLRIVWVAQVRLWVNEFVRRSWLALPAVLLVGAAWLGVTRLALAPHSFDFYGDLTVGAALACWLVWAMAHGMARPVAARHLDRVAQDHDALATALWLADTKRDDGWAHVQAQAAQSTAKGLRVAALVPIRAWQTGWLASLAAATAVVVVALAPIAFVDGLGGERPPIAGLAVGLPAAPQPFSSALDAIGEDAASLLGADARLLEEIEAQVSDVPTRKWLRDLRSVLDAVRDGSLDKRAALEKLAELDDNRPPTSDSASAAEPTAEPTGGAGDATEAERQRDVAARQAVLDAAKQAVEEAPKGQDKEELKKAIEQGDLGLIAQMMEKLAHKQWSAEDLKKWQKTLEKFADALKDRKVPKQLEELAKKIDRLQKQREEQGGLAPQEQRRLQEARHQLEQLRKQIGDVLGAEHQLQRLEKEVRAAADELRRQDEQNERLGKKGKDGQAGQQGPGGQQGAGGKQEAGGQGQDEGKRGQQAAHKAMRQAADELRRQDEDHKSRQAQRIGQSRLKDARDALGRGQEQGGDDEPCQGGGQGQRSGGSGRGQGKKSSKTGAGDKDGEDGAQDSAAGKPDQRRHNSGDREAASGKQGKGQQSKGQPGDGEGESAGGDGKSGKGGRDRSFRLGSKGLGDKSRTDLINDGYEQQSGNSGGPGGGGEQGDGAGTGKGGDNKGKNPKLVSAQTHKLKGQHGDGPDTKKVFSDAASKGFAKQGWRETYREYSEVAEEMLDKESLPAGRKALVRRYFEKIRPR